jgi:hypothetical protein
MKYLAKLLSVIVLLMCNKIFAQSSIMFTKVTIDSTIMHRKSVMEVDKYDPNKLPFFCKIEYKMGINSKTKMPMKFRLGDVQYVDELEKKR